MKRPCIWIVTGFALGEVLAYAIMEKDIPLVISLCIAALIFCTLLLLDHSADGSVKRRALVILGLAFLFGGGRLLLDMHTHRQYDSLNELCTGTEGAYATEVTGITVKGERLTLRCGELLVYYTPSWDSTSSWDSTPSRDSPVADSYDNAGTCNPTDNSDSAGIEDIFSIGDRILITGDFEQMDRPRNPGEFNYYLYYLADGVTHRCFADSIEITGHHVDTFADGLFRIRQALLRRIDLLYGDDDSGVLRAVLLGDKSELSEDINDLYRKNGIAHLLAISGLHIGIIGMSFYALLRKKLKLAYTLCGLIAGAWVLFYCMLTGAGVSTLRATIMLLIMFLSGSLGMHYDMLNSAGIAALIILIIHPYQLFGCGFLLSFACIIAIAGPSATITKELKLKNALLKSFILSITIQLFTLPITSYFFFEVSPYGCLLNLIVIPLMTFVVWSSLIATLLTFVWPAAAVIISYISHYILSFYTWLGSITLRLPLSTILIGRPALWQIFVYYSLFFSVLYSSRLKALIPASLSSMWGRVTASTSMREKTSS